MAPIELDPSSEAVVEEEYQNDLHRLKEFQYTAEFEVEDFDPLPERGYITVPRLCEYTPDGHGPGGPPTKEDSRHLRTRKHIPWLVMKLAGRIVHYSIQDWTCPAKGDGYDTRLRRSLLDPSPWYMYIGWLQSNGDSKLTELDGDLDRFGLRLVECYNLACYMEDDGFKDHVLRLWNESCLEQPLSPEAVSWAYLPAPSFSHKPAGLATRKLIVDQTVALPDEWRDDLDIWFADCPPQFMEDVERKRQQLRNAANGDTSISIKEGPSDE
ncbi:hypothetical protein NX059_003110 [Plenodomus lindquistii]|nr:hypothetical protein NX059_003110 [Plenodomus lindquistii]